MLFKNWTYSIASKHKFSHSSQALPRSRHPREIVNNEMLHFNYINFPLILLLRFLRSTLPQVSVFCSTITLHVFVTHTYLLHISSSHNVSAIHFNCNMYSTILQSQFAYARNDRYFLCRNFGDVTMLCKCNLVTLAQLQHYNLMALL